MDEIKIKHQDIESNENKNIAMALFKAVDDDPIIDDVFSNYTSTDRVNDIFIQVEPYAFNMILDLDSILVKQETQLL